MRERPDNGGVPSGGKEVSGGKDVSGRRIDLSVPQVAGSAVAAVVAAKLASYFGVYGTILGAGVVSAVAACGGPVFQHFFRRTGEQLRGAATAAGPVPATFPARRASASPLPNGEFTPGTVYRARARARGWRRPVLAAALVFGVTMAGITAYEAAAGSRFGGGHGTTVGAAVTGHHASPSSSGDRSPAPSPSLRSTTGDGSRPSGTGSGGAGSGGDTPASQAPTTGATGTAGAGTGKSGTTRSGSGGSGTTGSGSGGSGTTGSGSGGSAADPQPGGAGARSPEPGASATTPAPSASSRSGTAAGDPAGPAAP
ncbi:hypothetical protein [Streptomyces anandii]|uniref:hypothetical protein n=1 Tax=Streptomyces anandii TaxID=285454 RepID=UPI001E35EA02|nr:hypothetical protein [Streptomyces anandii]